MVRIGIIGIGFMGYTHFEAARKLRGGQVAAIATRNPAKLAGDWTSIQGNFGPRGGHVDLSDIARYADYHELLADPEIDLVDICLPNDLHEPVVLEAIAAGKSVLVEKPIAVDLEAAQRMVSAAQDAGTQLMVGHVLPFFPEFQFAADCIASQRFGSLQAAHFRRVITPPTWSAEMSDFRKLGGWGIDLHIHDNHFISLVCGVPQAVFSRGIVQDGFVNHVHSQYVFGDPQLAVTCVSGGLGAPQLQFAHGFEIYLERATLQYAAGTIGGDWVLTQPLTVITDSVEEPSLDAGTEWCAAFTLELQAVVDAITSGTPNPVLDASLALDALRLCHAEARSIVSGEAQQL